MIPPKKNESKPLQGSKPKNKGWRGSRWSKQQTITPAICGDASDTLTVNGLALASTVLSIRTLPLSKFIDISCDNNLTALADKKESYTDTNNMQLQAAWMRILSEFYLVSGDEQATRYVELLSQMEGIRFRAAYMDFLLFALSEHYSEDIAAVIRTEHPRFAFTEATYLEEIEYVKTIEKRHSITYQTLKAEFESMEKVKGADKTTDEKRISLMQTKSAINKHDGYAAVTLEGSTYEFALGIRRLQDHYKQLERQANK